MWIHEFQVIINAYSCGISKTQIPACLMARLMMPNPYYTEVTEKKHYMFSQGCLPKLTTKVPAGGFILNDIHLT